MVVRFWYFYLGAPRRWRLVGGECGSNSSQGDLHFLCERVRATKHAPRDPFHVFDRCHCLAEIVERGAGVLAERYSVCMDLLLVVR